jgi:hypothetical protein
MHSKQRKAMVAAVICKKSYKLCSAAKTEAQARMWNTRLQQ